MKKIDIDQGSHEWHKYRWENVGGTSLKDALGSPKVQETFMYKLISQMMTEPQIIELNTPAVTRGIDLEPLARRAVIEETGLEFVETGMLVSDDIEGFALSPDAIYEEDGKIIGGLEIKCPDSKKHVEYFIKNEIPKEYFHQVLAPFLMSDDIQWWYFASYDDRNYERPLFLLEIRRNVLLPLIEEGREKLKAFLERVRDAHATLTF